MKLKSLLKVGLPILGVAALSISLPLALTSCSDSSDDEVNTTQKSVENAAKAFADLSTTKIGESGSEKNYVSEDKILDIIHDDLKVGKNTIESINVTKISVKDGEQSQTKLYTWAFAITLKEGNKWAEELSPTPATPTREADTDAEKESTFESSISKQTLTLTVKNAKFDTIALTSVSNSQEILSAALEKLDTPVQSNGAGLEEKTGSDTQQTVNKEIKGLFEEMNLSNFISNSIKTITLTQYQSKTTETGKAYFAMFKDTDTSNTSDFKENKYEVDLKFTLNDGFIVVTKNGDKATANDNVTVEDVEYVQNTFTMSKDMQDELKAEIAKLELDEVTNKNQLNGKFELLLDSLKSNKGVNKQAWSLIESVELDESAKTSDETIKINLVFAGNTKITVGPATRDVTIALSSKEANIVSVSGIQTGITTPTQPGGAAGSANA